MKLRSGTKSSLADFGLVVAGLAITALYAGWGRPLWIDEFVQFAMGGMDLGEALQTIWNTTGGRGVNWGQTGIYYFLDYLLGSLFGASLFAVRLPSIVAAFMMLMSAILFLRLCGISRVWQAVMLLAFVGQSSLMYYTGEARPYMPMASFTVAALAYYRFPLYRRRSWFARGIGVYALIIGSVFHPYWIIFLGVVLVFSIWCAVRSGTLTRSWSAFARFLNPALLVPGVALYFLVAATTWLKSRTSMSYDPFEFVGSTAGWVRTMFGTHLPILYLPPIFEIPYRAPQLEWLNPTRVLALVVLLLMTVLPIASIRLRRSIAPPAVLLWAGVMTTVVLSVLSYSQGYWIVQRQWLGGISLVTVAVVWFFAELTQSAALRRSWLWKVPGILFVLVVASSAFTAISGELSRISNRGASWVSIEAEDRSRAELVEYTRSTRDWVYLANVNIARGGGVWREVAGYYGVGP